MIVATKLVLIVAVAAAMVNAQCSNNPDWDAAMANSGGCAGLVNFLYGNGYTCSHSLEYITRWKTTAQEICCGTCSQRTCVDAHPNCDAFVGDSIVGGFEAPCDENWVHRDVYKVLVDDTSVYGMRALQYYPGTLLDMCCKSCTAQGKVTNLADRSTTPNPYILGDYQKWISNSLTSLDGCAAGYSNLYSEAVSYYEQLGECSTELGECSTAYSDAQEFIANVDEHVEGVESAAHQSVLEANAIKDKYLEVIHDKDATIAQLAQCQNSATTCAGNCGTKNPSGACHCDMFCSDMGDCCNDFQDHCAGSCEGSCGGKSLSGECHCDPDCTYFSDCCSDFAEHC